MTTANGEANGTAPPGFDLAKALLGLFRGRRDHVAVGRPDGSFAPQKLETLDGLPAGWLAARHLAGVKCLGFYLMDPLSRVWCSAADFDNKSKSPDPQWREKAEKIYYWLTSAGLMPLVEVSQSGEAAHVWMFFEEPTPAWIARAWWRLASEKSGVPVREVYPRQDELSGKEIGNLIRYPLWNRSRFVDVEDDWATIDPAAALDGVRRTSGAELRELAFRLGCELRPHPAPGLSPGASVPSSADIPAELPARVRDRLSRSPRSLLARRWGGDTTGLRDPSRSALAQSVACELVRQYVPTPEVQAALRVWCRENDYAEKGDRPDWIARTVGKAYEYVLMRQEERSADMIAMRDACHAYIDTLERGEAVFVPSGIPDLDSSVDGVGFGEMCVVAARPGHGKSAIALQWLDGAASRGTPCLLISEEMSRVELGKRALLSLSVIAPDQWDVNTVPMLRDQVDRHYQGRAPVYLVENCNSVERATDVIAQLCGQHGVRLVAVDYLQLLRSKGKGSRYEEVTDISQRLKQAAKANNCALIALCQMNRAVDSRDGKIPKLSDLRDTGGIEQDADLILFCQWPWKYDPTANQNDYLIYAAKRRNGPIRQAKIETTFWPDKQRVGPAFGFTVPADPFHEQGGEL